MNNSKNEEKDIEISIIMPCLNEEKAVGVCIAKCFDILEKNNIKGEVIVADNGSKDKSREIILKTNAILIDEPIKGYGSAYPFGFKAAKGKYLFMADSDDTYDFSQIPIFIESLRNGYDFVIGNRLKGTIDKGNNSMPWLHRYVGNPFLTSVLRLFFKVKVGDAHCGMRAITKDSYQKICLKTTGMEFASEMIIKAGKLGLKIKEIPTNYRLRVGESKLRTFKDGWRHLRFMLLYSPTFLYLIPGLSVFFVGMALLLSLSAHSLVIGRLTLDYHYMFVGSLLTLVGYQIINLGLFTKIFSYSEKFEDEKNDKTIQWLLKKFTLEKLLVTGLIIFFIGLAIFGNVVFLWMKNDFGSLFEVRKMILALTFIILGTQTIFNAFFYSILLIEKK